MKTRTIKYIVQKRNKERDIRWEDVVGFEFEVLEAAKKLEERCTSIDLSHYYQTVKVTTDVEKEPV